MKRREFITLAGGAAVTWPLVARAQQPVPVVGFLNIGSAELFAENIAAFNAGLKDGGYVDGRNVTIEYRWARGNNELLPGMATDLVRRQVAVIVATGGLTSALAAKAATTKIPIVFQVGVDPVAAGLVASLNRPGANLTGVTNINIEVGPKRLEMLHDLLPNASLIAILINPTRPTAEAETRELQAAADMLRLRLHILHANTESDLDTTFATLAELRVGGLMISGDAFFNSQSRLLATLAMRYSVPTIYQERGFVVAGGLMGYGGGDSVDDYRQAGVYASRILKGEKPAELPVQQSTKVGLMINLKTAKALGLTFPLSLLGRANEVIE